MVAVIRFLDGGIGQLRGNRAPGRIIRCNSVPDRHSAVTHYTGTTFGVRARLQRICHTLLIDDKADQCNTQQSTLVQNRLISVTVAMSNCGLAVL